jgi:hypothetical protein
MKFKRNILGVAVLSGSILLAGQAVADASLDAPDAVAGIPAAAVTVSGVVTHSVAGTVSWAAANSAVNTLNTAIETAAKDVKDLAAIDKSIVEAEGRISAAKALSAGQLIGGKTGAEIIKTERESLGVNVTTGVFTAGTSGLYTNRSAEAAQGVASAKALATAQAAVNTLAAGGISNSLILGLQAAAQETAQDTINGTLAANSDSGTLGKIAFDADAAIGAKRTNAVTASSNATKLRKAADDAAKAVTDAAAAIAANSNGSAVNTNAGSYQANTVAGADATFEYDLADVTTAGKVIDVRDQTKQIVWTIGSANNSADNTGTFAELVTAINANDMDYTAEVGGTATKLKLTATDTKLGREVGAAKVGTSTTAALAAADSKTPVTTAVTAYKAKNLTTFDVNLAELKVLSAEAANELSAAIAKAANTKAVFTAGEELEASYASSEKANFTEAGTAMATINGVLNEDLARANAATAAKEKDAVDLEAITSEDVADLDAAQAKLTSAKADVASAAAARDKAREAFVADATTENSTAYSAALTAYNTAVGAQTTATAAVTAANNVLYGTGNTAATKLADQNGTNKTSVAARADVVTAQKAATAKEKFLDMQVQLAETGNPAGVLQAGLIAEGDSGALVVTAVNSNYQATKTNSAGIAANVATLAVHEGLVTKNIADIATNTTNIATNTTNIATNTTNIATNTTNIASNTSSIAGLTSSLADTTANLQRVELQMNENVDMLKSGIASALAVAGMPTAPGEGMGFSIGTGYFDGESAVAMGLTFVEGNRSFKVSFGHSGSETSASAGAAFKF